MRKMSLALMLLSTVACVSARAQIMTNPVQDYINKTTLLNNILSNRRATDMSQKAQTKGASTDRRAAGAPAATAPETTRFNPAGAYLLPRLLAEKTGAAGRGEAEQFFNSLLNLYARTAQKDGFPANDLAYAFEYFVVNSYMIYHDLHDVDYDKDPRVERGRDAFDRLTIINEKKLLKVTPLQERAIYSQIKTLLTGTPAVQRMTDREKQELTELLAIMFGVNYAAYMKGVNSEDEGLMGQSRQAAKAHLEKLLGMTVERIKIGDEGLRQ
jgi:hypothetical protein